MAAENLDYLAGRRVNWAGILALVVGLSGSLSAGWYSLELSRKLSEQEARVSGLQEREAGRAVSADTGDAEQIARETKQANAVILALSLPWKEFFDAVEATGSSDVAVLAIDPDAQKGLVRINAEANRLESMLKYVSRLQKIAMFRDVVILNHQIQEQDPQKPVRFTVQAAWEIRQ